MTDGTTTDRDESTQETPKDEHLGVLATWRATSVAAKAVLTGVFVNRLAGFIQIFLVLFLTHRGFSGGQAGFALGMYGAGSVIGTFVGGSLSDKLSARAATLIGMVGSAALIVSLVYVKWYPAIVVVVLLVSATAQFFRPAAQSLITEVTPANQRVMVTAMYRLAVNLGTTAAPLLGLALVSVSYNLLFWGEALTSLLYAAIAFKYLPRKPAKEEAAAAGTAAETAAAEPSGRTGYLALLDDKRYLAYLLAFLLLCTVYCQYIVVLPLAIKDAGLSAWWYGAIISMNAAIVVTCEVLATKWVQKWPVWLVQMSGFGLLAVGYAIYGIEIVPFFLILGTLVWTLSEILGAPTVWAWPGMVAPEHLRGRYFGSMQTMFGLSTTLGPIAGVLIYQQVGARTFFLSAAGVVAIAMIIGRIGMSAPTAEEKAKDAGEVAAAEPELTEPPLEPPLEPIDVEADDRTRPGVESVAEPAKRTEPAS